MSETVCPNCKGYGLYGGELCEVCGGTKQVATEPQNLDPRIENAPAEDGLLARVERLLPCPFCGAFAALVTTPHHFPTGDGYFIECQGKCGAYTCHWHHKQQAITQLEAELKQAKLDAKGIRELWQSAEAENAELRKTSEQKHEINCQLTEERDKFAAELAELRKALAEERMDDDSRWQLLGKIAKLEIELDKHRGIKVEAPEGVSAPSRGRVTHDGNVLS